DTGRVARGLRKQLLGPPLLHPAAAARVVTTGPSRPRRAGAYRDAVRRNRSVHGRAQPTERRHAVSRQADAGLASRSVSLGHARPAGQSPVLRGSLGESGAYQVEDCGGGAVSSRARLETRALECLQWVDGVDKVAGIWTRPAEWTSGQL